GGVAGEQRRLQRVRGDASASRGSADIGGQDDDYAASARETTVTDHDTVVPEPGPSGGGDGNLWQRLRLEKRKGVLIGIVALVAVIVLIVIATRHSTSDSKNGNDAAKGTHVVAGQTAVVNGVSWHAVKGDWNVAPNSTIVAKAGNLALSML